MDRLVFSGHREDALVDVALILLGNMDHVEIVYVAVGACAPRDSIILFSTLGTFPSRYCRITTPTDEVQRKIIRPESARPALRFH